MQESELFFKFIILNICKIPVLDKLFWPKISDSASKTLLFYLLIFRKQIREKVFKKIDVDRTGI